MKKYPIKYTYFTLLLALIGTTTLLFFKSTENSKNSCQQLIPSTIKNARLPISQLVIVKFLGGFKAKITACQLQGKIWQRALSQKSFTGVIGRNGIASVGEKKEGDLKTPVGLYPFGEAFGSQPLALKMDYKYITADDKFIDDVTSVQYNTWINGAANARNYESMLIGPYKMGVVIKYNMNPVIAGAGSAIFMHLWSSSETPTAGCVAMDERYLLPLLQWLDKKQHPYIYIIS